nr:hypothetical protein [Tanacetum cinerariifolium]
MINKLANGESPPQAQCSCGGHNGFGSGGFRRLTTPRHHMGLCHHSPTPQGKKMEFLEVLLFLRRLWWPIRHPQPAMAATTAGKAAAAVMWGLEAMKETGGRKMASTTIMRGGRSGEVVGAVIMVAIVVVGGQKSMTVPESSGGRRKKFYNSLGSVPNRCSVGKTRGLLSFSRGIGWEGLITI